MTPRQAAELIGCATGHVRYLLRHGKIKATQIRSRSGQVEWDVQLTDVREFLKAPKIMGRPRGSSRKT